MDGCMMNSSEQINEIAKALAAAQADMPTVKKDATNPFFRSRYADLTTVIETVNPHITQQGLSVSQFVSHADDRTTLKTFLLHTSGQWIGDEMILHLGKNTPQDQGSAITYARRYAFCSVLGIVADEDDDGNSASVPAQTGKAEKPKVVKPTVQNSNNGNEFKRLFAMLGPMGLKDDDARHKWASETLDREVTTFKGLSAEDISLLEKKAKEQQMMKTLPPDREF